MFTRKEGGGLSREFSKSHGVRSYRKGNKGNMGEKNIEKSLLYLSLEEFLRKKLLLNALAEGVS